MLTSWTIRILCLALLVSSPAWALTVTKSRIIKNDKVQVQGKDAIPETDISWQGVVVTQSDSSGHWQFESVLPPGKDCTGFVEGINDARAEVRFAKCDMRVRTIYATDQDSQMVPPGDVGFVRSRCELGDVVVSGEFVVFASNFRMTTFGSVGDGGSGEQSWAFDGVNEGSDDADIRVVAHCADIALSGP